MRFAFVLITGLVLSSLGQAIADDSGDHFSLASINGVDNRIGILHFNGSNEEYAVFGEQADSVNISEIEEWSYPRTGKYISLGTWIKPEQNPSGLNRIMEFKLDYYYELFMEGSLLKLLEVEESDHLNPIVYSFPSLSVSMSKWHFVLISIYRRRTYWEGYYRPMVYTKSLDKEPLKLLDSQVTNATTSEEVGEENMRWNNLTLGRGFKGRIAPVLIGKGDSSYRYYRNCISYSDHSNPKCIRQLLSVLHGSNLVSSYKLSPNSNIKLEPYTEISAYFATDFQCQDSGVSLSISPTALNLPTPRSTSARYYDGRRRGYMTRYYTDYPVNITLGTLEYGCNLTWDSSKEIYKINDTTVASCGFRDQKDGEQIYMNNVYSHTYTDSKKLMDVSCKYTPRPEKREELIIGAYVVEEISIETTHTFTPWPLSLHLYSDSSFSERYASTPLKLQNFGENIYAEARVEADVEGVVLEIESCRTQITLNELNDMQQTTLIKDNKIVSSSANFLSTDDTTRKRFAFRADKFEEYPKAMVFLSCVLTAKQGEAAPTNNSTM